MITTVLLLLILIVLACNYYIHHRRNGRLINLIPGPPNYPIFGSILQYLCSQEECWKLLVSINNQYYSIWKVWILYTPVVSIRHPDDLETILSSVKHIDRSAVYNILHSWVGTGLFTSNGTKWHSRRKILTNKIYFNILEQFVELLIEESENMTNSLKNTDGTVVKDLVSFCSEYMLNAICETTMGTSLQDLGTFQQRYQKAVHRMNEFLSYRLNKPWLYTNWLLSLTLKGKEERESLKILHGFTEQMIEERKFYLKCTNGRYLKDFRIDKSLETNDAETTEIRKKRLALLDLLIAASQEELLTDLDIRKEVDSFMAHDTTAISLSFILALLAEHKDIQDRVRNEIDTVMQENGEKLTVKTLQSLSYLERCIKEALRLYPSICLISRVAGEDVKLQSYVVPAGTILFLNVYGIHRDPNFWPNPEVFDPDRFLPENSHNRHPYSYIPFSAGPRNCIGQQYALLKLKAMVALLIHNFYLEPVDYLKNIRLKFHFKLSLLHPLRVRFVPVHKM